MVMEYQKKSLRDCFLSLPVQLLYELTLSNRCQTRFCVICPVDAGIKRDQNWDYWAQLFSHDDENQTYFQT